MTERREALLPGKNVLVVDDDRELATLIHDMLSIEGAEVQTVGDEAGALGYIMNNPVDLVLTDISLEGSRDRSGLDLVERIRLWEAQIKESARSTPIAIIVSGCDADRLTAEEKKKIISLRVEILPKPYRLADLRTKVALALASVQSPTC